MIWTTATGMVTQVVTHTTLIQESPHLGTLVAEHGLLGGLRRRIEDWREYPPHGPVAISTRTGTPVDAHKERQTAA